MKNYSVNKFRLIVAISVSAYFLYYCFSYTEWHFIDSVDLIIHEAGHTIFMFFGEFMHLLAGTLFQVILPFIFVLYFFSRSEHFSASILLFWVGQNIINVSVYASDAIKMELPLLGGDSSLHDWNNFLGGLGWLKYTEIIGTSIFILGIVVILIAMYYSFLLSFYRIDIPSYKKDF